MDPVRSSAKAIVIHQEKLLAIRHADEDGEWFSLPGGGQKPGETLVQALQRECREEIGIGLEVGRLRFVREYIGSNHEFAAHDAAAHQVDHFFECKLLGDPPNVAPQNPDPGQVGVSWLPIRNLDDFRLYPAILVGLLLNGPSSADRVYLGDVN